MHMLAETDVRISTIGAMRLTIDNRVTPIASRKALAVLVYLALQPSRAESRERIAALLWSDSGEEQPAGRCARACGG